MKSDTKLIDSFQIIGFVISTAVSIILIVAKQDEILSAILGLVLAVLTQLFDLQLRQASLEEKLLKANILSEKLYQDKWLLQKIEVIVDDYCAIKNSWFGLFKLRAEGAVSECHHILHSLAAGDMAVPHRSPYTFAFEGIKNAKVSIKGVNIDNYSWWRSTRGEKFLQENVNAIQKGVKFSRVFMTSRDKLQEIMDVIHRHHNVGIDVFIVYIDELPKEYNEGFTIMDDRVVIYREKVNEGSSRERAISTKPAEVERMIQRYNILMQYARRLDKDDLNLQIMSELAPIKTVSES